MITIHANKIKPNPIVQKTKDEVKKLVQLLIIVSHLFLLYLLI